MSGIIFSADISSIKELQFFVSLCSQFDEIKGMKVGATLSLRFGLKEVVRKIKEIKNLMVIYDHQKAGTDIPAMGKEFAQVCKEAEVDGLIIFPHSGPKTLEAFISASVENSIEPIVGLVMSHPQFLVSEGGFIIDSAPDIIINTAIKMGVKSFILPGTKISIVKKYCSESLQAIMPANILMPGIGTQGGSLTEAFKAVGEHTPFAIIGSLIYNSTNPKETIKKIISEEGLYERN